MIIRRILIILTVLVLLAIGYLLYRFVNEPEFTLVDEQPPVQIINNDPEEGEVVNAPVRASNRAVKTYWVDEADRSIYLFDSEEVLYRTFPGGTEELIIDLKGEEVLSMTPSLDSRYVLITAGKASEPTVYVIELATAKRYFLPLGASAGAWSPSAAGEVVFYKSISAPASTALPPGSLNIFSVTTGKSQFLAKLRVLDPHIEWPTADHILITSGSSGQSTGVALVYTRSTGKVRSLTEQLGLRLNTLKDSKEALLYGTGRMLGLISLENSTVTQLNVVTLPDKCAADRATIYCAVPSEDVPLSSLPDTYERRALYTQDDIIAISRANPSLGSIKPVFTALSSLQFDGIQLRVVGEELYTVNRYDNRLYTLSTQ